MNLTCMPICKTGATDLSLTKEQQLHHAVLQIFFSPSSEQSLRLSLLSEREWSRLLHWLDISGLALYFLDRLTELQWQGLLPSHVQARLQQNLADNTTRMRGMIAESGALHEEFEQAGLSHALLKGISLWPSSLPKPELRSQLDVDFLVAEADIAPARRILEQRGYYLHAVSGRSWEFKTHAVPSASLKDLYKDSPFRAVELHAEIRSKGKPSLLASRELRMIGNQRLPVLSPVDLFLGQGLHLYKHVCSEFYRASHLLEFQRHILSRRGNDAFWHEVRLRAAESPLAGWGLGVVTLLLSQLVGECAPDSFLNWTVDRLPPSARLWVEMYGWRCALGHIPGNKLYLLLQAEVEKQGVPARRSVQRSLIPVRLPPLIVRGTAREGLRRRISRYWIQLRFLTLRLRFHFVEGLRYAWELPRWEFRLKQYIASTSASVSPANKGMTIL